MTSDPLFDKPGISARRDACDDSTVNATVESSVDAVDEDLLEALLADLFLSDLDLCFCFVSVVGLRLEDPIRNGFFDDPSLDRVSLETLPCFLVRFLNIVFGFVIGGFTLR